MEAFGGGHLFAKELSGGGIDIDEFVTRIHFAVGDVHHAGGFAVGGNQDAEEVRSVFVVHVQFEPCSHRGDARSGTNAHELSCFIVCRGGSRVAPKHLRVGRPGLTHPRAVETLAVTAHDFSFDHGDAALFVRHVQGDGGGEEEIGFARLRFGDFDEGHGAVHTVVVLEVIEASHDGSLASRQSEGQIDRALSSRHEGAADGSVVGGEGEGNLHFLLVVHEERRSVPSTVSQRVDDVLAGIDGRIDQCAARQSEERRTLVAAIDVGEGESVVGAPIHVAQRVAARKESGTDGGEFAGHRDIFQIAAAGEQAFRNVFHAEAFFECFEVSHIGVVAELVGQFLHSVQRVLSGNASWREDVHESAVVVGGNHVFGVSLHGAVGAERCHIGTGTEERVDGEAFGEDTLVAVGLKLEVASERRDGLESRAVVEGPVLEEVGLVAEHHSLEVVGIGEESDGCALHGSGQMDGLEFVAVLELIAFHDEVLLRIALFVTEHGFGEVKEGEVGIGG